MAIELYRSRMRRQSIADVANFVAWTGEFALTPPPDKLQTTDVPDMAYVKMC